MPNDRQRVELIFLPMAMIDVIQNGEFDPETVEAKRAQSLFWLSVRTVLMDVERKRQAKLLRRAKRTHEAVLSAYQQEDASVAKVGLLVFYIVQAAAECDYLVLGPGSPFDEGMTLMVDALTEASEVEALNNSARKAARKALAKLHTLDLFLGVEIEDNSPGAHQGECIVNKGGL